MRQLALKHTPVYLTSSSNKMAGLKKHFAIFRNAERWWLFLKPVAPSSLSRTLLTPVVVELKAKDDWLHYGSIISELHLN